MCLRIENYRETEQAIDVHSPAIEEIQDSVRSDHQIQQRDRICQQTCVRKQATHVQLILEIPRNKQIY